jgi:hypothetical protein
MPFYPKPRYIDPVGDSVTDGIAYGPPMLFREVTARVFPLKANMARLTQFCDQYLNMDIPDSIVHFTPSIPYVYFVVLNYGGMSMTSQQAQCLGWVAQHEMLFAVPLQRWQRQGGKLVFQDWASVSPFIFVDAAMSQTTGREVYGWPKVLARLDADMSLWTTHPRSPTRLMSMSTNISGSGRRNHDAAMRVLLEVDRAPVASYAEFPADLNCPWSVTSVVPNLVRNSLSLLGDAADIALGLRMRGFPPGRNLEALFEMTTKAGSLAGNMLSGLLLPSLGAPAAPATGSVIPPGLTGNLDVPKLFTQNITLKQFRDPESPSLSCYTALVNSAMGVNRVNGSGLLGDWDLLRGDPSGGYAIRIHRYIAQPIIESLGIEVGVTDLSVPEGSVTTLKPSFPYWADVDLYYGAGDVICSRVNRQGEVTQHRGVGNWTDERARKAVGGRAHAGRTAAQHDRNPPAPAGAYPHQGVAGLSPFNATAEAATHRAPSAFAAQAPNVFSTALAGATQPVAGPFHFPDMTLQVYPLLADRAQLDRLIERNWNQPFAHSPASMGAKLRLETCGSYVYMVVTSNGGERGTNWSNSGNLDWWADHEVSFCIPVKWYRNDTLISLAVIEPFIYADNGRSVITDREVNGRNTVMATIDSPKDVWMSPKGPVSDRRLLHVATEIYPEINLGPSSRARTLLEIDERDVLSSGDHTGWQGVADTWGRDLVDDLKRKTWLASTQDTQVKQVKALALEVLAHEAPVNRITMKQYRDADDMGRACYQAAVHTERSITRIFDVREIEQRVHIRVHRIPGHPIVEQLGLKLKSVDSVNGAVVANLQPIRPFWMHVAIKEELGTIIGRALHAVEPNPADSRDAGLDPATVWDMTHPWFRPPPTSGAGIVATSERLASGPYFTAQGPTRVNPSLVNDLAAGNAQNLREKSDDWLRRSLTNELAMAKFSVEDLPQAAQTAVDDAVRQIDPRMFDLLDHLRQSSNGQSALPASLFRAFCDALSFDQMALLARTIEAVFRQLCLTLQVLEPLENQRNPQESIMATAVLPDVSELNLWDPDPITELKFVVRWIMAPPETGPDWTAFVSEAAKLSVMGMQLALGTLGEFTPHRLRLFKMTLPFRLKEALNALMTAGPRKPMTFRALQHQHDTQKVLADWLRTPVGMDPTLRLREIAKELDVSIHYWANPARWRRMTRSDAAASVQSLGDMQLVVESILSDEWEDNGAPLRTRLQRDPSDPRFTAFGPRFTQKPDHCIPVESVGPIGAPYHPWAGRHGLDRWPETAPDVKGAWVFVARERKRQ